MRISSICQEFCRKETGTAHCGIFVLCTKRVDEARRVYASQTVNDPEQAAAVCFKDEEFILGCYLRSRIMSLLEKVLTKLLCDRKVPCLVLCRVQTRFEHSMKHTPCGTVHDRNAVPHLRIIRSLLCTTVVCWWTDAKLGSTWAWKIQAQISSEIWYTKRLATIELPRLAGCQLDVPYCGLYRLRLDNDPCLTMSNHQLVVEFARQGLWVLDTWHGDVLHMQIRSRVGIRIVEVYSGSWNGFLPLAKNPKPKIGCLGSCIVPVPDQRWRDRYIIIIERGLHVFRFWKLFRLCFGGFSRCPSSVDCWNGSCSKV